MQPWARWRRRYSESLRAGRSGDRIPVGGDIFRTCPDRPWGPPNLLYNGYRVFPGGKERPGVTLTPHPFLVPWPWKRRAIPLPTLCATTGPVTGTLYLYLTSKRTQCSVVRKAKGLCSLWESYAKRTRIGGAYVYQWCFKRCVTPTRQPEYWK